MNEPVNQRVSPNRVALILVLLLGAWLVFEFSPRKPKPTPMPALVVTESKLNAVGLADNPDWEGLPEIFAIWADKAEWNDGRTRFGYWNPGSRSYSYFFEATRLPGGFRFRAIPRKEFSKEVYYFNENDNGITEEVPEYISESPAHPFVFEYDPVEIGPGPHWDEPPPIKAPRFPGEKSPVKIEQQTLPLTPPASTIKQP